jgi:hypothetical protein
MIRKSALVIAITVPVALHLLHFTRREILHGWTRLNVAYGIHFLDNFADALGSIHFQTTIQTHG